MQLDSVAYNVKGKESRKMKKSVLIILTVAGLLCAGTLQIPNHNKAAASARVSEAEDPQQPPSNFTLMPRIVSISTGDVSRKSNRKDSDGFDLPPWDRVEVAGLYFKQRPVSGALVTVVPLGVNIEPVDVKIAKAKACERMLEELPIQCEVELAPLTLRAFFEYEPPSDRRSDLPFRVLVLYPRVSNARALSKSELRPAMLPQGVSPNVVSAAVDLTGDGMPDVLVTDFCCDAPGRSDNCDYTCGKTRIREGRSWKVVDSYIPA